MNAHKSMLCIWTYFFFFLSRASAARSFTQSMRYEENRELNNNIQIWVRHLFSCSTHNKNSSSSIRIGILNTEHISVSHSFPLRSFDHHRLHTKMFTIFLKFCWISQYSRLGYIVNRIFYRCCFILCLICGPSPEPFSHFGYIFK